MPVVTKVEPQKNKKRVNVYLDGKFGFGLDLETFSKLKLKVEDELSETRVEKIVKEAEFQKMLDKLLKFVSLRPRSEKEIERWFKKHRVHHSLREELFNRLKKLDLVDDEKFARWWIDQRLQFKPKSSWEIKYELKRKGIDNKLSARLVDELVDQDKQLEMAGKLIAKGEYKWRKLSDWDARKKISTYLKRKGFGWSLIKEAVDNYIEKR